MNEICFSFSVKGLFNSNELVDTCWILNLLPRTYDCTVTRHNCYIKKCKLDSVDMIKRWKEARDWAIDSEAGKTVWSNSIQ